MVTRKGTTLVELVAAIPLLALLGLVAAMLVLNGQRVARTVDGRTSRTREMRHAAAALAAELRSSRSRDLHAWNDTLIDFDVTVGFAIACGNPQADRIDLLPATGNDPLRSTWSSAPDAGDRVHIALTPTHPTEPPVTHDAGITMVATSNTACASSTLRATMPGAVVRLTITPATPAPAIIGAPIRITRRTRISLYRASDNEWYIGLRTLRPSGWETIQPVAGPFASASERGLRFALIARNGAALAARTTTAPVDTTAANAPTTINLLLRTTSAWKNANNTRDVDSLVTSIALRNR